MLHHVRFAVLALVTIPGLAAAQDPGPRYKAFLAIDGFLTDPAADAAAFVQEHVAPSLVKRHGKDVLATRLDELRQGLVGAEADDMGPEGPYGVCVSYLRGDEELPLILRLEEVAPHRLVDAWIEGRAHLDPSVRATPIRPVPLTWDTLDERMAAEVENGFSGALLILRDGEIVHHAGHGLANRAKAIPATGDTVFAIGSTPIDFTKAGILLLEEAGLVGRDTPITEFFDDVPADKRGITVGHLMTGASGLEDFHDLPGDSDPDHHWIDRDEAVRRILAQDLLFEPGTGQRHSHSAWGLLAVILEVVSGQTYPEFTRENLFEPLGMEDTGFFGEPVSEERLAIGYGERTDGEVNAPPYWGPTSWLVMGSGGQVSTVGDLARWLTGLRAGELLSPASQRRYWSMPGEVLQGGDMYGFQIFYTEGPDDLFVLITNSSEGPRRRHTSRLSRDLNDLLRGRAPREAGARR